MSLEALHYHAERGNFLEVQSLVNEGVDPDGKDRSGTTPLMLAVEGSHKEVVELLINSGADIHGCDDYSWTVMFHALVWESVEMVQCLVNKGFSLEKKDPDGRTPLMLAVTFSCKEAVEVLINSGANIHCCDDDGWTLMHHASSGGSKEIVQCLVNKGVSPEKKGSRGETPLMLAVEESSKEIAELLINSGVDIHCCDDDGWTLMHNASCRGSEEIVQYLLNKEVVLDKKGSNGQTPLMWAVDWENKKVVELLINSGANIHCFDDDGRTLMHYASRSVEMVQYLLNKGVVLDKKDSDGQTPLMLAVERSNKEAVEVLINSGANINCCDDAGRTLMHASRSVKMVQYLLKKGLAFDKKDSKGQTLLMLAVLSGRMEIVDHLLKVGADCNLENNDGESPFNRLLKQQRPNAETVKLCIEKGAYVKSTDYYTLLEDPSLKKAILQETKLCSQAVFNKFNNRDLPLLYERLASAHKFPPIEKMKLGNGSGMALAVEQAVSNQIQTNGFCNLFQMVPSVLSILSVKSFIEK